MPSPDPLRGVHDESAARKHWYVMSDSDSATPSGEDAFPKSLASGSLSIGEKKVECHVLSDGRRVLDTSQAQAIFGAAKDRHFRRLLSRIPNASRYFKVRPGNLAWLSRSD